MIRLAFIIFALIFAFPAYSQVSIELGGNRDRGYDRGDRGYDRYQERGYDRGERRRLPPVAVYPEDNQPEFGTYTRRHRHERRW